MLSLLNFDSQMFKMLIKKSYWKKRVISQTRYYLKNKIHSLTRKKRKKILQ